MTGGAGFLGLHLVRDRLLRGRHVTVLAHAGGAPGRERIERFLAATGEMGRLPAPLGELLTVIPVDIEQPLLGLPRLEHRRLARIAAEVWHVAASVELNGRDERLRRTNVLGTQHVLRLASLAARGTPLRHVSTAFVAGTRQGHVSEDDVPISGNGSGNGSGDGFENAYERSKHEAEELVREWAERLGRRALILRPGVLVPPGPRTVPELPSHTLSTLYRAASRLPDTGGRTVLRVGADPRARLNLLPVDWAADAMARIASGDRTARVSTVHIVHPDDVPVRTIAAALEDVCPVRIRMTPAMPAEPTAIEGIFYRRITGFLPYLHHRRSFDDSTLRKLAPGLAPPPPIDRTYLRSCFGVHAPAAGAAAKTSA
ncbi:SDR family oxidoreductase [Actinomadura sp. KC216]|uniref:SDR family oxidoreductase n=1 Tax=Actinomadura sp. KC216 TaxID=2530370 RepID=UPI0014051791|nr:SDR family oxidoreductase [Actinomadura sp. KC216]